MMEFIQDMISVYTHFVVAPALRTRHAYFKARLFIAQEWHTHFPSLFVGTGFRTKHLHFPLFVCRRRLPGLHTSACQLQRGRDTGATL